MSDVVMAKSVSVHLREIGDVCSSGSSFQKGAREEIMERLIRISKSYALALYEDLLLVQLIYANPLSHSSDGERAQEDDNIPRFPKLFGSLLDWNDHAQVEKIYYYLIDNGKLMERVSDCIDLDVNKRRRKWGKQEKEAVQFANQHVKCAVQNFNWSRFNLECRVENKRFYDVVYQALSRTHQSEEWAQLIMLDMSDLKQKDRLFWYAIQTNRRTIEEKRAICHKLSVAIKHNIFPQLLTDIHIRILSEIYTLISKHASAISGKPKAKFKKKLYRLLRGIVFLKFKSRRDRGENFQA